MELLNTTILIVVGLLWALYFSDRHFVRDRLERIRFALERLEQRELERRQRETTREALDRFEKETGRRDKF
jgi:hypothetical protein